MQKFWQQEKHKTYWLPLNINLSKQLVDFKVINNKIGYYLIRVLNYFFVNRIRTQVLDLLPSDSKIVGRFLQSYHRVQIYEWNIIGNARGSSVVSSSARQARIWFNVSLKLCLNLCSFKWLNSSLKRVSSFIPSGS